MTLAQASRLSWRARQPDDAQNDAEMRLMGIAGLAGTTTNTGQRSSVVAANGVWKREIPLLDDRLQVLE